MKNVNLSKNVTDGILMLVGSLSISSGIVFFLMPHKFAAGGPPGLAVMINELFNTSPGLIIFSINTALMILGLRSLGFNFLMKTLMAILMISLSTDILLSLSQGIVLANDRFLNAIYAGVAFGLGIGLIFRSGGSSGGWSILARVLADKAQIAIGQAAAILDTGVVLISAVIFQDYEAALLGGITVFVTGQLIDKVLTRPSSTRLIHVSSYHSKELQSIIDAQFGTFGSILSSTAMDNDGQAGMLYLTIERRHLKEIVTLIKEQDTDAHITVTHAVDVAGQSTN